MSARRKSAVSRKAAKHDYKIEAAVFNGLIDVLNEHGTSPVSDLAVITTLLAQCVVAFAHSEKMELGSWLDKVCEQVREIAANISMEQRP